MVISILRESQRIAWDNYVRNHPQGTVYHLYGWQNIIKKTYGHRTYYLIATEDKPEFMARNDKKAKGYELSAMRDGLNANPVVGMLPLVHIKHFIFGNRMISMPFLDYGGILADDRNTENALLSHAAKLSRELKVRIIELRQIEPLSRINEIGSLYQKSPNNPINQINETNPLACVTDSHRVRMLLRLPENAESLMNSFKSKLRSQIKKPIREGCRAAVGHGELVDDFYQVFSTNMRDLGSPVHSKRLIKNVLIEFPHEARICMVFKGDQPLAASLVIGFRDTLENPWASSLREFSRLGPNMLLYWTMLEHACNSRYKYFDFGRSSPGAGTYRFKAQWGSKAIALNWHYISVDGHPIDKRISEKSKFEKAIRYWQKLPVQITKIIGPSIRKHIGL